MTVELAAGVTLDFYRASEPQARFSTAMFCPIYFVCCLLTPVPRIRETGIAKTGQVAKGGFSFR